MDRRFADPSFFRHRKENVVAASMLAHILDELDWGLITGEEAILGAGWVLKNLRGELSDDDMPSSEKSDARTIILDRWRAML